MGGAEEVSADEQRVRPDYDWWGEVVAEFAESGISKRELENDYLMIEIPGMLKMLRRRKASRSAHDALMAFQVHVASRTTEERDRKEIIDGLVEIAANGERLPKQVEKPTFERDTLRELREAFGQRV